MKVILDTNILISSFIFKGKASIVHEYTIKSCEVYTSDFILNEFFEKLKNKFGLSSKSIEEIEFRITADFILAKPTGKIPEICRDVDDNNILHLAKSVQADFIITGDKDLLDLKFFKKTEIISPYEFSKRFVELQ